MAKYIYICSHGHSGSTLLDLLLGSHSRIESLGEISFLSPDIALNLKCSCGTPIRECEVWKRVIARLSQQFGKDIMREPYALELGPYGKAEVTIDHAHQTPRYLALRKFILGMEFLRLRFNIRILDPLMGSLEKGLKNNLRVYDTVREVMGTDLVVDSSKSYLKAAGLYRMDPENVRIILLTRDGRGVLYSNMKRKRPRNDSVTSWMNQYTRALPLFRRHVLPGHLLHVKYENLAADPSKEMLRICTFLEIDFEPAMLDFSAFPHHSSDGNNMRFQRTSEIRVDTSWKDQLSAADLEYFEQRAGNLNRELGYK